jgi:D-alanyl-lipoteichoic acid acyltransferase DltB (MBOAT superfamily)
VLFNSAEFIAGFFPAVVVAFFLLGRLSRNLALAWLIVASLFYYAWWRPLNVVIIAPSILINFAIARALVSTTESVSQTAVRTVLLVFGIVFNVLFLGYFKYYNFVATIAHDVAGTGFVMHQIVLPLGISFITFQKIAFLVDVHAGRVKSFGFRDYCLFVLFFPQLVAGPIVHYPEVMPQFHKLLARFDAGNVAVGLTLFLIGLFKKVVLADSIAAHVGPIYASAAAGAPADLLLGWVAALGFTLQIYFDFSGYSDMALGLARCFGIRLPANFDSPLKATSIIDFWSRWHITLTRFLTAYLYNPLALKLTRRRFAKGLPSASGRTVTAGSFLQLIAGPTILTMFVSGVWHGAGYTFVLWGLLHGAYLAVNHAWRVTGARLWKDKDRYERVMKPVGWAITFVAVAIAMVLFKAPTVAAAGEILPGLVGLHGVAVPQSIYGHLGPLRDAFGSLLIASASLSARELASMAAWIVGLLAIVLLMPNSLEILARYESALGFRRCPQGLLARWLEWRPTLLWAAATTTMAVLSVYLLGGRSEFVYWQF